MPTSDARTSTPRRILVALGRVLAILATVAAVDVCLCLAIEPYAGSTELMWSEYRKASEVDTVIVGSSVAGYGLSPAVLDEHLGTHSFNMGTPGQSLHDSLTSIQCAYEEHGVRRAILGIGYETIIEYPAINSSVVYTQNKCLGESVGEMAGDVWSLVSYPYYFSRIYSLSCAFPWTYDHVDITPEAISANISRRMTMDTLEAASAYAEASGDEGWGYYGQGYDAYDIVFPATHQRSMRYASHDAGAPIIDDTIESLRALCAWCEDAGVELYVIGAPYLPSVLMEYDEAYVRGMAEVKGIAESCGARFLDLNMAHRDVLDLRLEHFMNAVHLNHDGAEIATATVASLIADLEAGRSVDERFFALNATGWQEWLSSVPFVDSVDYASARNEDGSVYVEATVRAGTNVDVIYRLELDEGSDGSFEVVRDWDVDPTCTFAVQDPDAATIRVSARGAQDAEGDARHCEGSI